MKRIYFKITELENAYHAKFKQSSDTFIIDDKLVEIVPARNIGDITLVWVNSIAVLYIPKQLVLIWKKYIAKFVYSDIFNGLYFLMNTNGNLVSNIKKDLQVGTMKSCTI